MDNIRFKIASLFVVLFLFLIHSTSVLSQNIVKNNYINHHKSGFSSSSLELQTDNPNPPANPIRLMFIHHSTGGNWLANDNGGLGIALMNNNYFVSDVSYGWGPNGIGDRTDIGNWWEWFKDSENSQTYLDSLYVESGQNSPFGEYSRLTINPDPTGENKIILFKSCFPNSALQGNLNDPIPTIEDNPLRGDNSGSEYHTISNAKGIYIDILEYFKTRQDKLFIVITAPPLSDSTYAGNARSFNNWLINDWLKDYSYKNVFVFDFYNILTSNGGDPSTNDLNKETGNHHRWWNNSIQHKIDGGSNVLAYPSDDDHPNQVGNFKATAEFLPLLNVAYNRWKSNIVINYFKISGVITANGIGLSGASVRLTGNSKDTIAITNSIGKYEFNMLPSGSIYSITPSKESYAFNPTSYTFGALNGDSIKNFTATAVSEVHFNDSNLETEIRKALNKLTGTITASDLSTLTSFSTDNKNISDLTGLEYAVNLTDLDLHSNQIQNISPLSGLNKLTSLSLYDNRINNLNSLSNLTALTSLYIGYNPITDISVLSKLVNLTSLHLPSVQTSNFTILSNLSKLTELLLNDNQIISLSFISNLTSLTTLHLEYNQIADIGPLSNLSNLTDLRLSSNKVNDLMPISNLKELRFLYLGGNLISNVKPLSNLTNLIELSLADNQISDISTLSKFTNLTDLELSNNKLSDLSLPNLFPLKSLSNNNVHTNINGVYETGYFDLRGNIGFTQAAIQMLDAQLPLLSYDHILWNSIFSDVTNLQNPLKMELYQNYPNPFNPETEIKYSISGNNFVTIKIYDIFGREIESLINKTQQPGFYSIRWCPTNLSSGTYYYKLVVSEIEQLNTGKYNFIKRMLYIK
jgi:Leucine-rich repeat (LRR) protein